MATTAEARTGSGRRLPAINAARSQPSDTVKTLPWPQPESSANSRAINYEKIIKLLTNRHTAGMQDRHVHSLNKIVRRSAGGVLVDDVESFATVLTVIYDHASSTEYLQSVTGMLDLVKIPVVVDKTSKVVLEVEKMPLLLAAVAKYLSSPAESLVQHAAAGLAGYYKSTNPRAAVDNAQIVRDCEIASAAAKALTVATIPGTRQSLLTLLNTFATHRKNIQQMVSVDGFASTVHQLYCRTKDKLFQKIQNLALDLEWMLLESECSDAVADQIASEENVHDISNLLRDSVKSAKDAPTLCQARNDVLSIYVMLMESKAFCKVVTETLCVDRLVRYCVLSDLGATNPDCDGLKFGKSNEDLEMHMLLVQGLVKLALQCSESRPRLSSGGFLTLLFQYLLPHGEDLTATSGASTQRWSPPMYEELQLQALACLARVLPLCLDDFQNVRGTTQLLQFLKWCCSATASNAVVDEAAGRTFRGAGNTFFSAGEFALDSTKQAPSTAAKGRRSHALMCLRALVNICHADTGPIRRDMIDQGLLELLLNIVHPPLDYPTPADRLEIQVRTECWSVMAVLCEYSEHAKELFGQNGVETLLPYLRYEAGAIQKDDNRESLLVAAVDAVWSCVDGCDLTLQAFFAHEGLFALLDILENCNTKLQSQVLGCISDLCLHPVGLAQTPHWRSEQDDDITVTHLLLKLWHCEQATLGVSLAEDGILADSTQPLVGIAQREAAARPPLPAAQESPAVLDVSSNLRSKIYLLLSMLNFGESFAKLSLRDEVALLAIKHYPTLKRGEVLLEVANELERENVKPIEIDQECISVLLQSNLDAVNSVRDSQADCVLNHGDQVESEEQECYSTIRVRQLESTIRSETFERFVERTANHEALEAAKAEQDKRIEDSRELCDVVSKSGSAIDHSNVMNKVRTTTFSAKKVQVLDPV